MTHPHLLANERYARQLILDEIGESGQDRLARARVLVVGAGGLGSPAALYLAAAGVGTIGLVDKDIVTLSNLQRQILHDEPSLGLPKVESGRERLQRLNSSIRIVPHAVRLDESTVDDLLREYDIALGCLDNFATRYTLDAACVRAGKPHVFAAVWAFEGQIGVFGGGGACYRCFFGAPPEREWDPGSIEGGILGPIAGVMGCFQAVEAVKLITGIGKTLRNRLLLVDGLGMRFREMTIKRDPECLVCGADSP